MRARLWISILILLGAGLANAQVANMSGGWKLNASKSKFGKVRKPLSIVLVIEHAEPKLSYQGTIVYAHEDSRDFFFEGLIDGKECPATRTFGEGKVAVRRVDPRTISAVFKTNDGLVTEYARTVVSSDGKLMRRRISRKDPSGEAIWTEVYERGK